MWGRHRCKLEFCILGQTFYKLSPDIIMEFWEWEFHSDVGIVLLLLVILCCAMWKWMHHLVVIWPPYLWYGIWLSPVHNSYVGPLALPGRVRFGAWGLWHFEDRGVWMTNFTISLYFVLIFSYSFLSLNHSTDLIQTKKWELTTWIF